MRPEDFTIGADGIPEPVLPGGELKTPAVPARNGADTAIVEHARTASAEDGVEDLRKQLAERDAQLASERQARTRAEAVARENEQRAARSEATATDSRVGQIKSAIEAREAAKAAAKRAFAEAMTAGEFDKASDVQAQLGELAAEVVALKRDQQAVELESRRAVERAQSDPVEGYIRQNGISGPSAAWLRQHPEAMNNPRRLGAAHSSAVDLEGLKADSPEYFAHVEKLLGIGTQARRTESDDVGGDHAAPVNPRQQRQDREDSNASVAAPVSRKVPSTSTKQTKVVMTPEMKHHAEIAGLSEEEYAKHWLAAKNSGALLTQ